MVRISQTIIFPPTFLGRLVTKLGLTLVTPLTVARQAPLSIEFPRQEYWSGLPCPLPGDVPDPGIEPMSLMSPALAGGFYTTSTTWEAQVHAIKGRCHSVLLKMEA